MPRPMIGSVLAVHDTTMSKRASSPATRRAASSGPEAVRELVARSTVRLATVMTARVLRGEMRGGQLDHLAGADQQHFARRQFAEDALGQAHGRGGHRHRMRADLGAGSHFLGDREGALEKLVQQRCPSPPACATAARPASSGRGSAARPAPSSRARWPRGRRGARRRPAAAGRRSGGTRRCPAAFPRRRNPPGPAQRRAAVRPRSRARCGCRSRRSPPRSAFLGCDPTGRSRMRAMVPPISRHERHPLAQRKRRGLMVQSERDEMHKPLIRSGIIRTVGQGVAQFRRAAAARA